MVGRRLALLLACSALGAGIGAVGQWLTGDGRWYLALPAVIALGWLFVADPTRCQPPPGGAPRRTGHPEDTAPPTDAGQGARHGGNR
jgi:hypothetical protein